MTTSTMQICRTCHSRQFPSGPLCRTCWNVDLYDEPLPSQGRLVSFETYRRRFDAAFPLDPPYVVAVAELTRGVRVIGNMVDYDGIELACGLAVDCLWTEQSVGSHLSFRPKGR